MKLEQLESRQLLSASIDAEDDSSQNSENPAECDYWMWRAGKILRNNLFMGVITEIFSLRFGSYAESTKLKLSVASGLGLVSSMTMTYASNMPFIKILPIAIASDVIGLKIGEAYVNAAGAEFARRSIPVMIVLAFSIPIKSIAEQACDLIEDTTGSGAKKPDSFVRG